MTMPAKKLPPGVRKHATRSGYEYRFTYTNPLSGGKKRQSVYRSSLPEILDAKRRIEQRVDHGLHFEDSRGRLGEWAEYWLQGPLNSRELKQTTLDLYRTLARKHLLSSELAAMSLKDIKPTHVEAFMGQQLEKASAPQRGAPYTRF
jgi:hypothetical protein